MLKSNLKDILIKELGTYIEKILYLYMKDTSNDKVSHQRLG